MDFSSLFPYITNGSIAIAVVLLMLTQVIVPGWMYKEKCKENAELRRALGLEREGHDKASSEVSRLYEVLNHIKDLGGRD